MSTIVSLRLPILARSRHDEYDIGFGGHSCRLFDLRIFVLDKFESALESTHQRVFEVAIKQFWEIVEHDINLLVSFCTDRDWDILSCRVQGRTRRYSPRHCTRACYLFRIGSAIRDRVVQVGSYPCLESSPRIAHGSRNHSASDHLAWLQPAPGSLSPES